MDDRVNGGVHGGVQVQPGSVARTLVPHPFLLEGPPVYPLKFSLRRIDVDCQQMQSQMRSLQEQHKVLVDGQKIMIAFFEKFLEICQREIVRDPMTSIPVVNRGDPSVRRHDDTPIGVQVPGSSYRSVFLRLGKQVLLDNQTEGARPEDVVATVCHPAISQEVLSSSSVTGTSRWQNPRVSHECLPQAPLEGILGRNYEYLPDPPVRRPARLHEPPRHREGRVEDRPADPQRVEVRSRVKGLPVDPRGAEVPVPAVCLQRLNLTKEILLNRMEERLHLRRGGQDEVHQSLGGERQQESGHHNYLYDG